MMGVFVQLNESSHMAKAAPIGYVVQENGCWQWVGGVNEDGYGQWTTRGTTRRAHREMYERAKGPVPLGLELDHLCRNRGCVNPDHLEAVVPRTNILRGKGPTAVHASRTECARGHVFDEENTVHSIDTKGRHRRECRACKRTRERRVTLRRAEARRISRGETLAVAETVEGPWEVTPPDREDEMWWVSRNGLFGCFCAPDERTARAYASFLNRADAHLQEGKP